MNMKQLETFYWAARLGSFAKAAERVNASQSTVSVRIQELEQSLGTILFDRSHRRAQLTAKGAELLDYAKRMMDLSNELRASISEDSSISGFLRIGVVEIVAFTWMPKLIAELGRRFPNINVGLEVDLATTVADKLREGHLDIILAPRHLDGPNFTTASLGTVSFCWAAHPSIATEIQNSSDGIGRWPLIVMSRQSQHYVAVEKWLQKNSISTSKIYTCNSLLSVRNLAIQKIGIGFLPQLCFPDDFEQGSLKAVKLGTEFQPVEYFVTTPVNEYRTICSPVAKLAEKLSTFVKG